MTVEPAVELFKNWKKQRRCLVPFPCADKDSATGVESPVKFDKTSSSAHGRFALVEESGRARIRRIEELDATRSCTARAADLVKNTLSGTGVVEKRVSTPRNHKMAPPWHKFTTGPVTLAVSVKLINPKFPSRSIPPLNFEPSQSY